jgi:biopolymer transport protein ExbD
MRIARPARRKNSIVITSLVDVMFVLLFFFMLASSYLDWGAVDVNIGGGESKSTIPVPGHVHQLQLLPGAQLRLDGKPVVLSQLPAALERDARVIVQPQIGVPLQEMVAVIDRLKAAGVALTLGRASAVP